MKRFSQFIVSSLIILALLLIFIIANKNLNEVKAAACSYDFNPKTISTTSDTITVDFKTGTSNSYKVGIVKDGITEYKSTYGGTPPFSTTITNLKAYLPSLGTYTFVVTDNIDPTLCGGPTSLTFGTSTTTYTVVAFSAGCASWDCKVADATGIVEKAYTLAGLSPNTSYDIYVCQPNCSSPALAPFDPMLCKSKSDRTLHVDWVTNTCDQGDPTGDPTGVCAKADVNGDGIVDLVDTQVVAFNVDATPYDPKYDMNMDGSINTIDVSIVEGCQKPLTGGAGAGANPCTAAGCPTALGNIPITIKGLADKLLAIGIGLAGGFALILIVVGAIRVLVSQGDQQKLNGGREMIIAAVAGILFLIFATLILQFIGISILKNVPGIG